MIMQEKQDDNNTAFTLQMLSIYESEYEHRDNYLSKEVYYAFYATLSCTLAPFLLKTAINDFGEFKMLFPIAGIGLSIYFLILSLSCIMTQCELWTDNNTENRQEGEWNCANSIE